MKITHIEYSRDDSSNHLGILHTDRSVIIATNLGICFNIVSNIGKKERYLTIPKFEYGNYPITVPLQFSYLVY